MIMSFSWPLSEYLWDHSNDISVFLAVKLQHFLFKDNLKVILICMEPYTKYIEIEVSFLAARGSPYVRSISQIFLLHIEPVLLAVIWINNCLVKLIFSLFVACFIHATGSSRLQVGKIIGTATLVTAAHFIFHLSSVS